VTATAFRGLAALLLILLAPAATAQDWPDAGQPPDAAAALFPQSATLQRQLLAAAHQAGDRERVGAGLGRLAALGYAPTDATLALLAPHLAEGEMAALRLRFAANRAAVQASRPFADVPAEHRLVEGIAWDAPRNRLFAATVVSRALLVREPLGWVKVEGLETGSLLGLAIDARRELLWMASARLEQTPSPESAFRGLIALDLNSLMPAHRLAAPGEGSPGDIAVAADGTVYASDPLSGAIYRARPGDSALSILVPPGRLRSPQGLVPAADGRRLYVSDYARGLAVVTLADGSVGRLESDVATMLDGIDGLHAFEGGLIAVQNGTNPRRILLITLNRAGTRIAAVRVLESNHAEWGEPTLGFVRGGEFVYVADSQWERYGPGGAPQGEGQPRATAIRLLRP
jgi:strictosidine synthase-like protein